MRDWVTNVRGTHYILGTVYGAHPYPLMVRNFQRVIGDEARRQILEKEQRLPDVLIRLRRRGLECHGPVLSFPRRRGGQDGRRGSRGEGIQAGKHAARFQGGSLGVREGTRSFLLQDEFGQVQLSTVYPRAWTDAAVGPRTRLVARKTRVDYT